MKHIEIADKGDYMAVITYDEKVKIYNMASWRLVITMDLKPSEITNFF